MGRQIRTGKRGTTPNDLAPILNRLGLDGKGWCELVNRFGRFFTRAAGNRESVAAEAECRLQTCMQAPGLSVFATG